MKKTLLSILALALLSINTIAQNVNIPDANFKAFLVGSSSINTNNDSEIQMSEAEAFTGGIDCTNQNIADLTGIEAFTNLTQLTCRNNSISSLDLSQNTALTKLNCDQLYMNSIDLSQNTALVELRCKQNNFDVLDLSQNPNLTLLICDANDLTALDVSQHTALEYLSCGNNDLIQLDLSQNTALKGLYCLNNNLSVLNLSQNTALEGIRCEGNNLTELDLSQNTNLTSLMCDENNLTSINVSQNFALTELTCAWNDLTQLDVSNNTNLTLLSCGGNDLNYLNMKNISTNTLTGFYAYGTPNLTCIEVDDVAAATAAWTNIDAASSFATSCTPIVNIPDANFKAYLIGNSSINTNSDAEIQVSEAEAFDGSINCQNLNISDLTGIEAFTALTSLLCGNNPLGTLDVSQNIALETFQPHNNNLTSLDISQNTALYNLVCVNNNLTSLDLSQNTNLWLLSCADNDLEALDLNQQINMGVLSCANNNLSALDLSQNLTLNNITCSGNNLSTLNMKNIDVGALNYFDATSNSNLTCIDVDDVAVATSTLTNVDPQTSFSENCSVITVSSISVQGEAGASSITTLGGTLQMEATVLPLDATDNTYTWSLTNGTGSASIDANGLVTAIADGIVTVIATANDGSGVTGSVDITISNQTTSTFESNIFYEISIYPNPASTRVLISSDLKLESIVITDVMGRMVKAVDTPDNIIDVSDLSKGIYFLQVQVEDTILSKKIIKE